MPGPSFRPLRRGFTLIEAMVVAAIAAIIGLLGLAAYSRAGGEASPQNAAHDLSAALSLAHERAVSKSHRVWFVVYADGGRGGLTGNGAYFVIDDPEHKFGTTGSAATGGLSYGSFSLTNLTPDAAQLAGRPSPIVKTVYLDDYAKKTVRFGVVTGPNALAYGAPFASLTPSPCSFCTGSPPRGAIVFDGDGRARFVDGSGAPIAPGGSTAAGRAGGLGLRDVAGYRQYLYAISGPTSFTSFFRK